MTPALETALITLIYGLSSLCTVAFIYLIVKVFNMFDSNSAKDKPLIVQVEAQAKDNSYTNFAAQSQALGVERAATIAAKAQVDVARIEATAAVHKRDAEQAHLERVRLEQANSPA